MLTAVESREPVEPMAQLVVAVRDGDSDRALRAVARLRRLVEQIKLEQVARDRRSGWSWQEIAVRLGVTKQTVHRKYQHLGKE